MKVELLLNRTSYEKAVKQDDTAFNGWLHGPASNDPDLPNNLPVINLRAETWGGVLVYGPTGQVYALDASAFEVFTRLKAGETLSQISSNQALDISEFKRLLSENEITL